MKISLWDWNGTLVTKDDFLRWLQETHSDVYEAYWIRGKTDSAAKSAAKPEVVRLFEYASANDLYQVELIPNARERLLQEHRQGRECAVFTSIPKATLQSQVVKLRLTAEIDHAFSLDAVMERFNLPPQTTKEDPHTYQLLARYLQEQGVREISMYTDDGLPRIQAAAFANIELKPGVDLHFGSLYHFDPGAKLQLQQKEGYRVINNLMTVDL